MNSIGHVKVKLKISVMNDLCEGGKTPDCWREYPCYGYNLLFIGSLWCTLHYIKWMAYFISLNHQFHLTIQQLWAVRLTMCLAQTLNLGVSYRALNRNKMTALMKQLIYWVRKQECNTGKKRRQARGHNVTNMWGVSFSLRWLKKSSLDDCGWQHRADGCAGVLEAKQCDNGEVDLI